MSSAEAIGRAIGSFPTWSRGLLADSPVRLRNPEPLDPGSTCSSRSPGTSRWRSGFTLMSSLRAGVELWAAADESVTVAELAQAVYDAWGKEPNWERDLGANPTEAQCLAVDAAKAREQLGWSPRLSPAEAVLWTVDWYSAWHSGDSPEVTTSKQIEQYQQLLADSSTAEARQYRVTLPQSALKSITRRHRLQILSSPGAEAAANGWGAIRLRVHQPL